MQHYEPRLFSDDGLFPMPAAQRSVLYRRLAELLYRKSQQIKTLLFTASFEDDWHDIFATVVGLNADARR